MAAYLVGGDGVRDGVIAVVAVGSIAAVVIGVRWHAPANRLSWWALAGASVFFLLGVVIRAVTDNAGGALSLTADASSGVGYVLTGIGVVRWIRDRGSAGQPSTVLARTGPDRGPLIDAVLIACAALLVSWIALISPLISASSSIYDALVNGLFPVFDVTLLTLIAHLVFGSGKPDRAFAWLLVSWTGIFVGDLVYSVAVARHIDPPRIIDCGFVVSFVALGLAALDSSMTRMSAPRTGLRARGRGRIVLVLILLAVVAAVPLLGSTTNRRDLLVRSALLAVILLGTFLRSERALVIVRSSEDHERYRATHDSLTGLPNRNAVGASYEEHVGSAGAARRISILFLDLDNFKMVNDSYGHRVGDELVAAAAVRISGAVGRADTVIRYAGDKFVILTHTSRGAVEGMAREVLDCFGRPFELSRATVYVTATVGIARAGGTSTVGDDPDDVIREAETAMYHAKSKGPGSVAFFDESLRAQATVSIETASALRDALARDELEVFYQPVVDLQTADVIGWEALLRWNRDGVVRMPSDFVPIAEATGLIGAIGIWVLDTAVAELAHRRRHNAAAVMSVNVSVRQLQDDSFPKIVHRILARHGVPGQFLALEVTESRLFDDAGVAESVLDRLSDMGVLLVLDDFGTGYSSLSRLHLMSISALKIDKSFVTDVGTSESARSLIAAITAMADALGLATVAEGVETEEQARAVTDLGCHFAQGYLYGRPERC